jgi:hypothetical protein
MGERLIELAHRVDTPQKMLMVTEIIYPKTLRIFSLPPVFSGGGRSCGPPPPDRVATQAATLLCSAYLLALLPGRLESNMVGRLLPSTLPYLCFSAARRQLHHPRPTVYPSVPPLAKKYFAYTATAPLSGEYL